MRLSHLALVLGALALCAAACGAPTDPSAATDAGYAALGRGDAEAALDHFVDALEALGPDDTGYPRARMGAIEAKARLVPEAAAESLLAWAASRPDQVAAADHHKVGALLVGLDAVDPAIDVLHAGCERFPSNEKLVTAMESMQQAAAERGDDAVLARIAGLGYGGG
ncbi:MAG TPA: hypothetical protein VMT18_12385 [Planctomycetota bacterium]|nr:hypothetical protein [Planctomycetota bacterium]